MKRTILTIIILTAALTVMAQATQPCVVKQYNQKQQKTPLAGVQVEVRDAGSAASGSDGRLTLSFRTLKPGDRVPFRAATKVGYELMNKTAVEQWNISRTQQPFEIVLIQSGYFNKLKSSLKQSSMDSYHEKYEKARTILEKLQKDGKLKEQEYYQKLNELEDRYDSQLKNLDVYVDQFARIDLSELSEQEQRFVELAHAGRLDEAAEAYNTLNAAGKYISAVENVRKLNEDIAKLEGEKTRQQEAAKAFFAMLKRQVNTLKLAGGEDNYKKAGELLKRAALADTTNILAVWEYSDFAFYQHDFKDAERFLHICLRGSRNNPYMQATFLDNLGILYSDLQDLAKAEEYHLKALETKTRLYNVYPDIYRQSLATTQNNLGGLYCDVKNFAKAEEFYLKALENRTLLFNQSPDSYRADLASTQHNLGVLYWNVHNFAKSEEYYLKALENKLLLFSSAPETYRADLALTQNNIGALYHDLHDNVKAEEYYLKALENRTHLFAQNPDAYRADLAKVQDNMGNMYRELQNYAKAEEYHLKALENRAQLFAQNPNAYRADLANTQLNLGNLYYAIHDYAKSEDLLLKALANNIQLFAQNPEAYRAGLAGNQGNLGVLYDELHDYAKAEEYYLKALENQIMLFTRYPDAYRASLASMEWNLILLYGTTKNWEQFDRWLEPALTHFEELASIDSHYQKQLEKLLEYKARRSSNNADLANSQVDSGLSCYNDGNYSKAEEYFLKALENFTQLFNQNPDAYHDDMADAQYFLGMTYFKLQDYDKAGDSFLKALNNYTELFKRDPEVYRADVATMQFQLGILYDDLHDYAKSEEYFHNALENRTQLFNQNPDKYRADLALTQVNLMLVYAETDNWKRYDEMLELALKNYEELARQDSQYQEKVDELRELKKLREE